MNEIILQAENVTISYNGNKAVNNLSLNIRKGSVFGIVGPNGAGKTTLLKAILKLIPIREGKIIFNSQVLNGLHTYEIVRLGMSMTTQNIQTLNGMSVIENVLIGFPESKLDGFLNAILKKKNRDGQERREKANNLLRIVGLHSQVDSMAGALSFGQKKRLDIARSLAVNPELLLMDEPTAGLDMGGIEDILKILRRIKEEGKTILLVEHNMDAVRDICDEIVVLNFGEKIAQGTPEEVLNNPQVIEAYIGGMNG